MGLEVLFAKWNKSQKDKYSHAEYKKQTRKQNKWTNQKKPKYKDTKKRVVVPEGNGSAGARRVKGINYTVMERNYIFGGKHAVVYTKGEILKLHTWNML